MDISLRRTDESELIAIEAMEKAAGNSQWINAYSLAQHRELITDKNVCYLTILDCETPCGFFLLVKSGESIEFRRIVVTKKGQGIGQLAIRKMEQYCRTELAATRIWLDVYESNDRARHIYEKLGYEFQRRVEGEPEALLDFEKELSEDTFEKCE